MNEQIEQTERINQTGHTEQAVNRKYKDTLFRMLFKEKENLLELYNALNKTAYTDVNGLEITTLENAIYMLSMWKK